MSIFCEGTRYTKEKYEESAKISKEKGLPVLKHHLLPRTKGFNLMAKHVKGKSIFILSSFEYLIINFNFS